MLGPAWEGTLIHYEFKSLRCGPPHLGHDLLGAASLRLDERICHGRTKIAYPAKVEGSERVIGRRYAFWLALWVTVILLLRSLRYWPSASQCLR